MDTTLTVTNGVLTRVLTQMQELQKSVLRNYINIEFLDEKFFLEKVSGMLGSIRVAIRLGL